MGDNPFAEDDNPFAVADNPFSAEPDNPFGGTDESPFAASQPLVGAAAATPATYTAPPPAAAAASTGGAFDAKLQQYTSNDDSRRKQELVRQMEADLEAKKAALIAKERELEERAANMMGPRPPNWPVCSPILHHDIKGEIPVDSQHLVRYLYLTFGFTCVCYLWNFIIQLQGLFIGGGMVAGMGVALSALYVPLGPVLALYFWYLPVYNAFRQAKSSRFVIFFLCFGIQILLAVFFLIGIKESGGSGIITTINFYNHDHAPAGTCSIIMCLMWFFVFVFGLYLWRAVHKYYRGVGGNLQRDATLLAGQAAVA